MRVLGLIAYTSSQFITTAGLVLLAEVRPPHIIVAALTNLYIIYAKGPLSANEDLS